MIPKNIIQLYLGAETEDSKYLDHLHKGWQTAYPDWNHIYLKNEEVSNIVKRYSTDAWNFYKSIDILSYRADFARLILLHEFGGIYIDLDTRPNLQLDDYVVVNENMSWGMCLTMDHLSGVQDDEEYRGVYTMNHLAAAEKGSSFIKKMIEEIITNYKISTAKNIEGQNISVFRIAKLVSIVAWGTMLLNKLDELSGGDYIKYHLDLGYGRLGTFWISWDNEKIIIRKYRDFVTHIGSILLKDFMDTNPSDDPLKLLSTLYRDISLHNGEIKIYSRGLHGI
jgi:hypothetical protein